MLNVALFGCTAKAWRDANPELSKNGNIRDYATIAELTVLSNLETHNAELIKLDVTRKEHRQALIDTFVHAVYLYDDKMVITFNHKDGSISISFEDVCQALENVEKGSDLDCFGAPPLNVNFDTKLTFFFLPIFALNSCILPHSSAVIHGLLQET